MLARRVLKTVTTPFSHSQHSSSHSLSTTPSPISFLPPHTPHILYFHHIPLPNLHTPSISFISQNFRKHIDKNCSPEESFYDDDTMEDDGNELKKVTIQIKVKLYK